jgi:pyruvate/2-oxoglutarate dehydrogenase complex dihydrolipoamide acyltransferase (E2) component
VDATEARRLRRQPDLVVRAVAMAAAERPDAVNRFDGDALVRPTACIGSRGRVERGLLVPVIRDADRRASARRAREARTSPARATAVAPPSSRGRDLGVNLGMYGIAASRRSSTRPRRRSWPSVGRPRGRWRATAGRGAG